MGRRAHPVVTLFTAGSLASGRQNTPPTMETAGAVRLSPPLSDAEKHTATTLALDSEVLAS
jgi:hypothetical protein